MVTRKRVPNPFGTIPTPLTEDQILEVYSVLRNANGSQTQQSVSEAKRLLLRHYIRFGLSIVSEYVVKAPQGKVPEMISEMTWILWKSLGKIQKGKIDHHEKPNLAGYIAIWIRRGLQRFLLEEKRRRFRYRNIDLPHKRYVNQADIMELLNLCIENEKERLFIEKRIAGFNDIEIASMLHCTKAYVSMIRSRLLQRFNEVSQ